jgi:hypothetical protein
MKAVKVVREIINNQIFRTWVIILAYVLLYFMYATTDVEPEKARDIHYLIHFNQVLFTTMQALLSLTWHYEAKNKTHKTLFLSFSVFCLLRILYRSYVLLFDGYLVSSSPVYFMMLFIVGVLVTIERRWV